MKKSFFVYLVALLLVTGIFGYAVWSENRLSETENQNINNNLNAANINAKANTNVSANANINLDTSTWVIYDSKKSDLVMFKDLRPSFKISYPAEWQKEEIIDTLFISEVYHNGSEPNISVSWIDQDLASNSLQSCKNFILETNPSYEIKFYIEKELTVDKIKSVYLSYMSVDTLWTGFINDIIVCVPLGGKTFLIGANEKDSELIKSYFDKILTTVKFVD